MNNPDKKESVVLLLLAAFFFVVILILISGGCTPMITPTPVSASSNYQEFNYDSDVVVVDRNNTIIRFVDYDTNVVCYMYKNEKNDLVAGLSFSGGVDCLPIPDDADL